MNNATAKVIDFPSAQRDYTYYHADYMAKHEATNNAWIAEMQAAQALYESGTWKETGCKTWKEFCASHMPYADSTYREARMNIPVAELAAAVAATTLSREDANRLGKKLNEVIPEAERIPMRLSVLALALAYHEKYEIDKPVPDKNVIEGAYMVLSEERDNHTVSVDGKNYDFKEAGQVLQLREKIVQDIQAHSKKSVAIKITLKRVNGSWQVNADGDLPDLVELTYWRKDNG